MVKTARRTRPGRIARARIARLLGLSLNPDVPEGDPWRGSGRTTRMIKSIWGLADLERWGANSPTWVVVFCHTHEHARRVKAEFERMAFQQTERAIAWAKRVRIDFRATDYCLIGLRPATIFVEHFVLERDPWFIKVLLSEGYTYSVGF